MKGSFFGVLCCVALLCGSNALAATLLVGSSRTYKTPRDAIGAMKAGDTMIIDNGTYKTTFGIGVNITNFTIKSASGNPYKCILDGQGGVGSGFPLTKGKGIIHTMAPGTIQGIGFINGGGGDRVSDGEAGLYAESFKALSQLNVVNCSFDNNENGIFVPGASGNGANVKISVTNSIFSRNKPNGVVSDGQGHNVYISGHTFVSNKNIWLPSKYGNNLKSRALTTTVQNDYNKHDQGRCLDIASGGKLTVTGGVYTSVGPTAVSNFICYACENTNSGIYTPTISGLTIVGSRANDCIWNNAAGITMNFASTTQRWASSGASFRIQGPGSVTGIVTAPPQGTTYVAIPAPVFPPYVNY
eukprot:TRINITY_DN1922_c0_g1_i6.p1 TRINITY_DN1922_c0_g1~~TRINITY_DN1922_c0_g1_i6.p1  ORF type:complete len:381 (-),score=59.81 TRINITY_DN1922_c0_g1_i6:45-1115(-)